MKPFVVSEMTFVGHQGHWPYPSVIITCTIILLFLEICLFLLIE